MQKLFLKIILEITPLIIMIGMIPFVSGDISLTCIYIIIILISSRLLGQKNDTIFFFFGLIFMTISEYFFLMTGVEVFYRNSLFGIMPLWLPVLWGYGFVAIRHGNLHIERYLSHKISK